ECASGAIRKVRIDCHALDYISSAGLRVLLIMEKGCKEGVSLTGMNDLVSDILSETGFSELLGIE
ncbi:MAG: STAS domain-containing protein, partial [Lachnospiraceae bacterium]|nr:STAS domain-containing protein [Lachnospiraceae bacterium]